MSCFLYFYTIPTFQLFNSDNFYLFVLSLFSCSHVVNGLIDITGFARAVTVTLISY